MPSPRTAESGVLQIALSKVWGGNQGLSCEAHFIMSEFILSDLRLNFPEKPNKETLEAHEEALSGEGIHCENLDDFWKQMDINPDIFD